MALVVQKYGGSSVANVKKIQRVAKRIIKTKQVGNQVVAVVSAMGDTTDKLISLAKKINPKPSEREMDAMLSTGEMVSSTLLAMALHAMGYTAVSLSGAQAGIETDSIYSQARITGINPGRIIEELEKDNVVIVAGFQGINESKDVTTLGRGGSDTTAVALAVSLKANQCQIYTDVEGVFTADPRIVANARRLNEIGYEEMLELASRGARVVHPRAVEVGELYGIPIYVASSFNENPGTLIYGGITMEIRNKVRAIAHDMDVAKISILGIPDKPGIAWAIFEPLAQANISVDTIVQNSSVDKMADLSFTVSKGELDKAMAIVQPVIKEMDARSCVKDDTLAKISVVGTGMQNTPGYAARMFKTLSEEKINIEMITTSEIRITCIIARDKVKDALRALHSSFELDKVGI